MTSPAGARAGTGPVTARRAVHLGDLDVTTAGAVISDLDVHGFVQVRADDVVLRNVIVRGRPVADGVARGLVKNTDGAENLLIENSLLVDGYPSVNTTAGILGKDFTARHVEVRGGVDSVQIHGGTATVEDSLLHETHWYPHDPRQGGHATHNDGVQILGGHDVTLRGNTIVGASNFGILAAPQKGAVRHLRVVDNRVVGGYCAMRFSPYGGHGLDAGVTGNTVTPDRTGPRLCGLNVVRGAGVTAWANRYADGTPVVTTVTDH